MKTIKRIHLATTNGTIYLAPLRGRPGMTQIWIEGARGPELVGWFMTNAQQVSYMGRLVATKVEDPRRALEIAAQHHDAALRAA